MNHLGLIQDPQNFVIVIITPTIIEKVSLALPVDVLHCKVKLTMSLNLKLTWRAYFIFMATNLCFVPLVYFW